MLIGGAVQAETAAGETGAGVGVAFAARTGFDPRELSGHACFRIRPGRLRAWREASELTGRALSRGGDWVTP